MTRFDERTRENGSVAVSMLVNQPDYLRMSTFASVPSRKDRPCFDTLSKFRRHLN